MKFILVALFALIALSAVRADTEDMAKCLTDLKIPCISGTSDATCLPEYTKFSQCIVTNSCASKVETLSEYADCVSNCKSTNSEVQAYIDGYVDCINGTILSFAALVLSFFVLMF